MKKEKTTFSVEDSTKNMEGEKEVPFSDLKAGQMVSVQYKKDGDKLMGQAITVAHAESAKKEAPPSGRATEKAAEKE